jgi:hypothetical protein
MTLSCRILTLGTAFILTGAGRATMTIEVDLTPLMPMPAPRLHALMEETTAIWKPNGLDINWTTSPTDQPAPVVRIRVIEDDERSADRCDEQRETVVTRLDCGRRLGATMFRDDGSGVESTLALSVGGAAEMVEHMVHAQGRGAHSPLNLREYLVGRVLGRVLAHEIGHYVLGTPLHTPDGLMRPVFPANQLVAAARHPFALSEPSKRRLRERQ